MTKLIVIPAVVALHLLLVVKPLLADCELPEHDTHELNVYRAEDTCDIAVQSWLEDYQIPMSAIEGPHGHDGMWEACMRLATPVTVLPASQHYDTTDGAFWAGGDK